MKVILIYLLLACLLIEIVVLKFTRIRKRKRRIYKSHNLSWKREFVIGVAVGYGFNTEASDEIKKCFEEKEKKKMNLIENFFKKIGTKIGVFKQNKKEKLEEGTKGFINSARELFFELKNCPPLRQSILAFIGSKILNLAVKGVIYFASGMTGVLIKTGYDLFKLVSEIYAFYNTLKEKKRDYLKLGTSLGKILYYSQNIILRRRRFRRKK